MRQRSTLGPLSQPVMSDESNDRQSAQRYLLSQPYSKGTKVVCFGRIYEATQDSPKLTSPLLNQEYWRFIGYEHEITQ